MIIIGLTTKWKVVAVHLDVVLEVLDPREGVAVAAVSTVEEAAAAAAVAEISNL